MGASRYTKMAGLVLGTLAATAAFAEWSPPETITPPAGDWRTCYNFARSLVADDAGNLHAVFFEDHGAAAYYRRYDRAAGRWEASYRLDEQGGSDAALIIDARGKLHAFFKAGSAMCHRVADDAGRWSVPEYLAMSGCRFGKPSPLALPSGRGVGDGGRANDGPADAHLVHRLAPGNAGPRAAGSPFRKHRRERQLDAVDGLLPGRDPAGVAG